MKPLSCALLGCDWGPSWMSSDGRTRRICRRCGDWRGLDLDTPPPDGRPVNTPPHHRADWGLELLSRDGAGGSATGP